MKRQIGLFILGIIAGLCIYSICSFGKVEDKSNAILNVLKSNCKCDQINQFLYVRGLEVSDQNASTETAEYELRNCRYKNLKTETMRINNLLLDKVKGYKDIDQFTMEFVDRDSTKFVTITNGIVNN